MIDLRSHQVRAEAMLRAALERRVRRAVLALPTGAGKTISAADLIAKCLAKSKHSLFLAPRQQVCQQTWDKLTDPDLGGLDPELVSMVMGRHPRWRSAAPISVACADSLAGRDLAHPPNLVIVDEAHIGMEKWLPIVRRWPDAWIVGLTATPGKGLGDFFEEIVAPVGVRELTAEGYLAPATCYSVPVDSQPDLSSVPVDSDGDFATRPLGKAVDRPTITGELVAHWRRFAGGRQTIAFGVSIAHAEGIAAAFAAAGVRSACLHSKMSSGERAEVLDRFKHADITLLSSCDCLSEGFDAPWAKCALLVRPTESLEKYLQQIGRVLRPFEGQTAVVIDPVGNVRKHLLPDYPTEWTLEGAKPRKQPPRLTTCPKCWAVFVPVPVCPVCGHEKLPKPGNQLRMIDGELVEVTEDPTVRREPTREEYRAQLIRQAHAFGAKDVRRFVEARMAKKFGQVANG